MGHALDVAAFRRALESESDSEVRFDTVSRALYSTDASVYQIEPIGVALPRSRDALARIVRICAAFRCPLTMRGGGRRRRVRRSALVWSSTPRST